MRCKQSFHDQNLYNNSRDERIVGEPNAENELNAWKR